MNVHLSRISKYVPQTHSWYSHVLNLENNDTDNFFFLSKREINQLGDLLDKARALEADK